MPEGPPSPPPEAVLIRRVRESLAISPEVAAARARVRLSGARWRQIEAGYRKDIDKPVIAKAALLAQMAHAIGIQPDRLEAAGRGDAADLLREILRREPRSGVYPDPGDRYEREIWGWDVPEEVRRNLIDTLREGRQSRRKAM